MKKTLLILSAIAWVPSLTHATTVVFSGTVVARTVVDSNLATVPTTGLVWVGTFGNESFTFNPALSIAANVAAMTTAGVWHRFGLDTGTNLANSETSNSMAILASPAGKVGGTATDNNSGPTKADFFNNKPLYLWIFNASTPAASTEMGIFHATTAMVPWTFTTNANGVGDNVTYSSSTSGAPTIAAIGGAGSTSSTQMILVSAVPEPSVLTLAGLAGLGLLGGSRRRRRNV